ncbi:hypothetical protein Lfu02_77870 [Longispora fulva]|uniref:Conserved hypothetical protein CHP02391 domain-containing protein n=1 Tax=Longispora fulva TaxID=619741 RepID=A0A8J7KIM3_9ACTN|nr:TIGR02391 family protein [Longispora fulva]MBG6136234.1 hypothetical protein [Longispora fulva]GIG63415.1 hypothetical protein Lfu02_77870 [Longispora fulva]
MDTDWALTELNNFLRLTELYYPPDPPGMIIMTSHLSNRGEDADILASAQVVEQLFDRVIKDWRHVVPSEDNTQVNRWCQHRETAERVKAVLLRQDEVREKLGDNAPELNAAHLHPWIWDGARSLWQSGHYREAVRAAAVMLNAETQNKAGRRDVSETDLFKQIFTTDDPQPGKPRLRLMVNDGSRTFTSLHRGIMAYAEGCFAAIRNPSSHTVQDELPEDHGLEQLAAFSVLARWVDTATVLR